MIRDDNHTYKKTRSVCKLPLFNQSHAPEP